jgi:hypothetical protein
MLLLLPLLLLPLLLLLLLLLWWCCCMPLYVMLLHAVYGASTNQHYTYGWVGVRAHYEAI